MTEDYKHTPTLQKIALRIGAVIAFIVACVVLTAVLS